MTTKQHVRAAVGGGGEQAFPGASGLRLGCPRAVLPGAHGLSLGGGTSALVHQHQLAAAQAVGRLVRVAAQACAWLQTALCSLAGLVSQRKLLPGAAQGSLGRAAPLRQQVGACELAGGGGGPLAEGSRWHALQEGCRRPSLRPRVQGRRRRLRSKSGATCW